MWHRCLLMTLQLQKDIWYTHKYCKGLSKLFQKYWMHNYLTFVWNVSNIVNIYKVYRLAVNLYWNTTVVMGWNQSCRVLKSEMYSIVDVSSSTCVEKWVEPYDLSICKHSVPSGSCAWVEYLFLAFTRKFERWKKTVISENHFRCHGHALLSPVLTWANVTHGDHIAAVSPTDRLKYRLIQSYPIYNESNDGVV